MLRHLGYVGVVNRSQEDIDRGADFDNTANTQNAVMNWPEFVRIKDKMGIDVLRRTITKILAEKVKKIMPGLKQTKDEELKHIKYVYIHLFILST